MCVLLWVITMVVFFKQKTAYEMRISDWSSDVCSSDLTGFSPRDNTPEAVKPLLRREMDGFSIAFHQKSLASVGVASMQSRAFAGQAGDAFILCVPGSTGACRDAWDGLLEQIGRAHV